MLLAVFLGMGFGFLLHHRVPGESGSPFYHEAALTLLLPVFSVQLLVISVRLRDQPVAERISGWNLLGASPGGLLEYAGMAVGYSAPAVIVAIAHSLVLLLIAAARRSRPGAERSGEG